MDKKIKIFLKILVFLLLFSGCSRKSQIEIKIYVLGVDWSSSLYYFDEISQREKIFKLVKNILESKKTSFGDILKKQTVNAVIRDLPTNIFIFIPIASDELSYREKIYIGTPEEILSFIKNSPEKILPPPNKYTHKTDFIDFFNLAYNKVKKEIENLSDHISIKKGLAGISVEYILITDGIHDPNGIINIPEKVENITLKIITDSYPDFAIDKFSDKIKLPENTEKIIFLGVPPRIQFDLWNKVLDEKNVKCKFLEYSELKNEKEIKKKIE